MSGLNMSGMSKTTRHGAGILMTIIAVGLGLIMTYSMLSDPNFGGIIGTAADRFTVKMTFSLAVWGGIAVVLLGIWSGILESKQVPYPRTESRPPGRRPFIERTTTENGSGFTETVTYAEESPQQTLETVVEGEPKTSKKQKAPDFSYRGEFPKRKRKGYDQ